MSRPKKETARPGNFEKPSTGGWINGKVRLGIIVRYFSVAPCAVDQVRHVGVFYSFGAVLLDQLGRTLGEQRVDAEREIGRADHLVENKTEHLGHPLGATGARITGKAAQLLKREGKRYALATQCIGGGQGISTVLEAA